MRRVCKDDDVQALYEQMCHDAGISDDEDVLANPHAMDDSLVRYAKENGVEALDRKADEIEAAFEGFNLQVRWQINTIRIVAHRIRREKGNKA